MDLEVVTLSEGSMKRRKTNMCITYLESKKTGVQMDLFTKT